MITIASISNIEPFIEYLKSVPFDVSPTSFPFAFLSLFRNFAA